MKTLRIPDTSVIFLGLCDPGDENTVISRNTGKILPSYTNYEDGTECSETSAHEIQTSGNHQKERLQPSQHGESFKSGTIYQFTRRNLLQDLNFR
jgi:hypothetical protein